VVVHPGSLEEAARREVREETGYEVAELGPVILRRHTRFDIEGVWYDQEEHYFLVRVDGFEIDDRAWTDLERRSIVGHRWWTPEELARTSERIYPGGLADLLPPPDGLTPR
jgi:8-oxo-dGTP pyrophosphatase MutT (NUDIX family)